MSRHKIVKNLDLDKELDDFDGGDDPYYGEEEMTGGEGGGFADLSEEDQEQMIAGTIAVRDELGPDASDVTDAEIREALWYYYYDVGKTVSWLLSTKVKKESVQAKTAGGKKKKKKQKGDEHGRSMFYFNRDFWVCMGDLEDADGMEGGKKTLRGGFPVYILVAKDIG
jgi:hypothetical protein